jgi:AcrR family transcriptional regulator
MARPRTVSNQQIAGAVRRALLEHGPRVSTQDIARRVGVSQPALFKRFGTREGILASAFERGPPPSWLHTLEAGPTADQPVRSQLAGLLLDMMAFFETVVEDLVLLRAGGVAVEAVFPTGHAAPPLMARRKLAHWLAAAARLGMLQVKDPATVADAMLGALEARCFLAHLGGKRMVAGSSRRNVTALVDAWWHGIQPRKPTRRKP